jgi:hypothetical protein
MRTRLIRLERATRPQPPMVRESAAPVRFSAHWHAAEGGAEGVAMLHVSGVVDRRELGVRPRRPVDWIVGREVQLEGRLVLQPAW